MKSVICGRCKDLVAIVAGRYAIHGECPIGGSIYKPERIHRSGGGQPTSKILATMPIECGCGKKGTLIVAAVGGPNPTVN
jgi:hypothetical protein